MKEESRQTLISYYKWVVSLSIFVIGFSVSLVSAIEELNFSRMLNWGITLLLISVFINWLAVKRLVTGSIIENEEENNRLTKLFKKSISNLTTYGFLQNFLFIMGIFLVILSFL